MIRDALPSQLQKDRLRQEIILAELDKIECAFLALSSAEAERAKPVPFAFNKRKACLWYACTSYSKAGSLPGVVEKPVLLQAAWASSSVVVVSNTMKQDFQLHALSDSWIPRETGINGV